MFLRAIRFPRALLSLSQNEWQTVAEKVRLACIIGFYSLWHSKGGSALVLKYVLDYLSGSSISYFAPLEQTSRILQNIGPWFDALAVVSWSSILEDAKTV